MNRLSVTVLVLTSLLAGCGSDGCPRVDAPEPTPEQAVLIDPDGEAFAATAPDTFIVLFTTSRGDVEVEMSGTAAMLTNWIAT